MKATEVSYVFPGSKVPFKSSLGIENSKSTIPGILMKLDTEKYFIHSKSKKYTPTINDLVIGRIYYKTGDYYKLDLKNVSAVLPVLSFKNVNKKNKPDLQVDDYVFCRVISNNNGGSVDTLIVGCVEDGLGKLDSGDVFDVGGYLTRRIFLDPSILKEIGEKYKFGCAVGMNGRIWINAETPIVVREVLNSIKKL